MKVIKTVMRMARVCECDRLFHPRTRSTSHSRSQRSVHSMINYVIEIINLMNTLLNLCIKLKQKFLRCKYSPQKKMKHKRKKNDKEKQQQTIIKK